MSLNINEINAAVDAIDKFFVFDKKTKIADIRNSITDIKNRFDSLMAANTATEERLNKIEHEFSELNILHLDVNTKSDFISSILASRNSDSPALSEFKKLLASKFMDFANKESSLADEADVVLKLQSIEKDLERISTFPNIYNKKIIAIGGGFSSGKSSFINSLFKESIVSLPVGIKPVTAIPTYITSGDCHVINGCSVQRGVFQIDMAIYDKLSHDFLSTFSFNIKDIMPMMTLETKLDYENICFVDTPGYNPGKTEYSSKDIETAKEYLSSANILIWLIGADSNGTIPNSDIRFLQDLDLSGKKLYIILNKADIRSQADIESIIEAIGDTLEYEDIDYIGISAYSSIRKIEVAYQHIPLFNFLRDEDKNVNVKDSILSSLKAIFDKYKNAIEKDITKVKDLEYFVNTLHKEIIRESFENEEYLEESIMNLKNSLENKNLVDHLEELEVIRKEIINSAVAVFKNYDKNI